MFRLLIADDEMIERAVLYKTLQKNLGDQCVIFQAENGREALQIYEREKIQIAILDIEMPGINGIRAAEQIRERDRDCCIIFLTAFDEFAYAKKAITVRALDYLLKPYDEKELLLVMEEAMRLVNERNQQKKEISAGNASDRSAEKLAHLETEQGEGKTAEADMVPEWNTDRVGTAYEKTADPEDADPIGELEDHENLRLSQVTQIITHYIHENYMYDISMQDLARTMNYSEAYFCKLFKQCFNQNFTSYLTEYRVNEAKQMLGQPTVNVKEIGKAVGYADSNYFTKVFKRSTGKSPTEYRMHIFQAKQNS